MIAIISLLVSILLPSLTKARDIAKSTVCLHNLKTLSLALSLYAGDNNGSTIGYQSPWFTSFGFAGCWQTNEPGVKDAPPLNPYIGLPEHLTESNDDPGAAWCPAYDIPTTKWGTNYLYNAFISGSHYAWWCMRGLWYYYPDVPQITRPPVLVDEIEQPFRTVAVADMNIKDVAAQGKGEGFLDPIHDPVGYRVNMSMVDGHAEGFDLTPYQTYDTGWKFDYRAEWE